jgi:hypothetical protein
LYEGHRQADNRGEVTGKKLDEGVVGILDAVGAGLAAPEARVEVFFQPGRGDTFDAAEGLCRREAEAFAAEEADAGDNAVGFALEGLEHATGVGAITGLIEDECVVHDDGVGGEDEGREL